jgi:NADH dehydrogenase
VILLTGATGTVGSALLRRLTAEGSPVRALVRDPSRLGEQRVRVQIALGDLADPPSFRNALRGVDTVVHLAASIRDQPGASIEELNAVATLRLARAAERAGAQRFLFFSAMGASPHSRTRFFRAKALAQEAVEASSMETTVFSPSIVYTPGDPWLTLLDRLSRLPAVPVSGSGRAPFQPIWAEDVADAVMASLTSRDGSSYELAGPEVLTYDDIVRTVLRASRRRRRLLHVPLPLVRASLRVLRFATWEEAELMEEPMVSEHGTADARALGVEPLPMATVLGAD